MSRAFLNCGQAKFKLKYVVEIEVAGVPEPGLIRRAMDAP